MLNEEAYELQFIRRVSNAVDVKLSLFRVRYEAIGAYYHDTLIRLYGCDEPVAAVYRCRNRMVLKPDMGWFLIQDDIPAPEGFQKGSKKRVRNGHIPFVFPVIALS